MKMNFVVDGSRRFWRGKKALASRPIERKYADELAKANSDENEKIREQIAAEESRREKALNHKPSPGTLW